MRDEHLAGTREAKGSPKGDGFAICSFALG
jgi:hypothetical protein